MTCPGVSTIAVVSCCGFTLELLHGKHLTGLIGERPKTSANELCFRVKECEGKVSMHAGE